MLVFLMRVLKERINIVTIIISVTILISCLSFKNSDDKDSFVLKQVVDQLNEYHYAARPIDDEFSEHIYEAFINTLDYNQHFFTQKDINKLSKHKLLIDDQIKNGDFAFFDEAVNIINERIVSSEGIYTKILSEPFDFDKDEVYETDPCKKLVAEGTIDSVESGDCLYESFPKNNKELKESWRLLLKYQVLTQLYKKNKRHQQKKKDKDSTYVAKTFAELEEETRKEVLKTNNDWFKRLKQLTEKDRYSQYVNAITESYDPHTTYFPPKDKENFDIRMSGRLEGIGATLQEKDGYIKVVRIVPGSASWKQGDLKEEDLILKVGQDSQEPVDIVGMRLDEAVQLIRGKKGTEVRLTVKKVDGSISVIPIIRDIVVLEETYAKSNVIVKEGKKYGYINLPQFYIDFKNQETSCSNDVKKELEKLNKENVEGVILDLRNNGGGSLSEVVKMTGLFIESGPIVQVKAKFGKPYVLRDNDPSVTYDGDLVVLVNSFSASASEIFAAAIQDYNRGIIVGSTSTHGKGTVQKIISLDQIVRGHHDIKPLGAIKLTTQKFYRINGGATQLKGVTPDIIISDKYSYLDLGEKELETALAWDKIAPSSFQELNGYIDNISEIKTLSKNRVDKDTIFKKFDDYAAYLKKRNDITAFSLNFEEYSQNLEESKTFTNKYNNTLDDIAPLTVHTNSTDKMTIASDTSKKAMYDSFNKTISKDYYLVEAIEVLDDMKEHK